MKTINNKQQREDLSWEKYKRYYEMINDDTQIAVDTMLEAERVNAIYGMTMIVTGYSMIAGNYENVETDTIIVLINDLKDQLVKAHPEWDEEQVDAFYKI